MTKEDEEFLNKQIATAKKSLKGLIIACTLCLIIELFVVLVIFFLTIL